MPRWAMVLILLGVTVIVILGAATVLLYETLKDIFRSIWDK